MVHQRIVFTLTPFRRFSLGTGSMLSLHAFLSVLPVASAISFTSIGELPGGGFGSTALAVSADGRTVVGNSIGPSGSDAVRWTMTEGLVSLGANTRQAEGVSANGKIIAGVMDGYAGTKFEAFRWSQETGAVGLGELPGGESWSHATDISDDGKVIGGLSASGAGSAGNNREAFRWTEDAGLVGLGYLDDEFDSLIRGVSADGSVMVGHADGNAIIWNPTDGLVPISGGDATGVSGDGQVVVGTVGSSAFRWTKEGGTESLGYIGAFGPGPYPGQASSASTSTNANGSVVVGSSLSESGLEQAFIWDRDNGMRSLSQIVTDSGIDLSGWDLSKATDISANGKVIVGVAINPQGFNEGWVIDLRNVPDTGTTLALLGLALAGLVALKRKLL